MERVLSSQSGTSEVCCRASKWTFFSFCGCLTELLFLGFSQFTFPFRILRLNIKPSKHLKFLKSRAVQSKAFRGKADRPSGVQTSRTARKSCRLFRRTYRTRKCSFTLTMLGQLAVMTKRGWSKRMLGSLREVGGALLPFLNISAGN